MSISGSRELIPLIGIRYPEAMIKDVMQGVSHVLMNACARDYGRATGEIIGGVAIPHIACAQGAKLIANSTRIIKNLEVGNKVWRVMNAQEKFVAMAGEFGPIDVFAAETANLIAETQEAAHNIARSARRIANLSAKLMPDFIVDQVNLLAKDGNELAEFIKTTGENLARNGLPSSHGFEKYFAELKNLGLGETHIGGIAQHAYDVAVKENKVHSAFSELGIMVQSAKGIMKEIACLNPNEIFHIMAEKHAWARVVKDASNWNDIAKIMTKVMKEGIEMPHKQQFKKVLEYNGKTIEVIFTKLKNSSTKVANGWVKTV